MTGRKYYIEEHQIENIFDILNNIRELIDSFKDEFILLMRKQQIQEAELNVRE